MAKDVMANPPTRCLLEHDPEKLVLGLDPRMGAGFRKDHAQLRRTLSPDPRRVKQPSIVSPRQRIPARIKLCTNWRWNNTKATSSGAEVIRVAAVITDQSMP